ncbi:MAG: PQQ-like beta-propeller repeat protein [Chloroflexi bacterium]|nr:PQQ-like beta-propeller repeat protein [Chloroflexota bacterium]
MLVKSSFQFFYAATIWLILGIMLGCWFDVGYQAEITPSLQVKPLLVNLAQIANPSAVDLSSRYKLKWQFKTDGIIAASPALAGGVIYFGSVDKRLYAVDIKTGKLKWRFETKGILWSAPVVAAGTVYLGSDDGHLYALDSRAGWAKWQLDLGQPIWSAPTFAGGVIYVGCNDAHLYAVDSQTTQIFGLWRAALCHS